MNDSIQAALLQAARDAVERGWPVFPLRPGMKRPALHLRERCPGTGSCREGHRGWEQRASLDLDLITSTWETSRFNIGLACGPAGLAVVDLDLPKNSTDRPPESWSRRGVRDGRDVFALVCADHGQPVPDDTFTVATPSGGRHLYFTAPAGVELRNTRGEDSARGLGWKVDTRAHGGYVVAAGSTLPNGPYRVINDRDPAELPAWLAHRLAPRPPTAVSAPPELPSTRLPRYVAAAVDGEQRRVATAVSGTHTSVLFVAAVALGQLVGAGLLPEPHAAAALRAAAAHLVDGPCECTDTEITRTIRNGLTAGAGRPRTVRSPRSRKATRA